MLKKWWILTVLAMISGPAARAQINLDFENGLRGWRTESDSTAVQVDSSEVYQGRSAIRIGISDAGISQQIAIGPLSLVQYSAYLKSSDSGTTGYAFLRFFDASNRLLLEYKNSPASSLSFQASGFYTESPANTRYMTVGIRKADGKGFVYADHLTVDLNMGEPALKPQPEINIDEYMRPFWISDTVYNETVLLYSVQGKPASGKLLFLPDRIISVKSFDLRRLFQPGKDYQVKGQDLVRMNKTDMPYRADTSFDRTNNLAWYNIQSQWVVVTYIHHDHWDGPVPAYRGDLMPRTLAKLKGNKPLRMVALGMSITRGMNVSGYDGKPPYMPTYMELFTHQLKTHYRLENIRLSNAGLPGSRIDWGAKYTDEYVNALKPDLVILDFGMNDFWQSTPAVFKGFAQTIIQKIKSANPETEIILLSNMKFDPDYVLDSDPQKAFYQGNLSGYNEVFQSLQSQGVVNLDMTSISDRLFRKKKAKDCLTNPLHPNDYMARWYAQGLSALLIRDQP
jgi:lysophospholipase L1-like esterase